MEGLDALTRLSGVGKHLGQKFVDGSKTER